MGGTKLGGQRAVFTLKTKYGVDYFVKLGKLGGSKSGSKGFAYDGRTWLQKLLKRPTYGQLKARLAGKRGGQISRRK